MNIKQLCLTDLRHKSILPFFNYFEHPIKMYSFKALATLIVTYICRSFYVSPSQDLNMAC